MEGKAYHLLQASSSDDIPCVHETVEMSCALLDLLAHLVVDFHVEDIGHEIQSILVVLDLAIETREVKAICKIVLVDLAEVFVAAGGDELDRIFASAQMFRRSLMRTQVATNLAKEPAWVMARRRSQSPE